jgi:hypothetical protein|tara:strand:- start:443 stop:649 length:207 start_codon:yes stop_codon:yes gene_type:complete
LQLWYDKGLISKGDDIADYYLNLVNSLDSYLVEVDTNWNQEEYDAFKIASAKDHNSDIRTGRYPHYKR